MAGIVETWRRRARHLKQLIRALAIASRDPRTPPPAKVLAVIVVAYALSPIDLIPDPIPVLGYLDDLVLIPLGIALTIRLIPSQVWADAQEAARERDATAGSSGRVAATVIVVIWIAGAIGVALLLWNGFHA